MGCGSVKKHEAAEPVATKKPSSEPANVPNHEEAKKPNEPAHDPKPAKQETPKVPDPVAIKKPSSEPPNPTVTQSIATPAEKKTDQTTGPKSATLEEQRRKESDKSEAAEPVLAPQEAHEAIPAASLPGAHAAEPEVDNNKPSVAAVAEMPPADGENGKAVPKSGYRPLPTLDKSKLETIAKGAPSRKSTTLAKFCAYLKKYITLSEPEKTWLVFRWMSLNIAYDVAGFMSGNYGDLSPEGVFKSGKGVCSGYARLFSHIATDLGLTVKCVTGYAKGVGYSADVSFKSTNHEWNAVFIMDQWYLLDSTWGAGHLNGQKYVQEFCEYYFCPDPHNLIRSHYPQEDKWQLLDPLVSKKEFEGMIKYESLFYEAGFTSTEPANPVINESEPHATYRISFVPGSSMALLANLIKSNATVNGATFIQKFKDHFDIDVLYNSSGKYKLDIYAQVPGMENYSFVLSYLVTATGKPKGPQTFPHQYPPYTELATVLYSPKTGPLKKGTKVDFKVGISDKVTDLTVVIGSKWNNLQRNGEGVFEGEIDITADEVNVFYKSAGMSNYAGVCAFGK